MIIFLLLNGRATGFFRFFSPYPIDHEAYFGYSSRRTVRRKRRTIRPPANGGSSQLNKKRISRQAGSCRRYSVNIPWFIMKSQRLFEIVNYVNRRKFCSTAELLRNFGVSPATLNRDLNELAENQKVRKVRGGIASLLQEEEAGRPAASFRVRLGRNLESKAAAALQAEQLVRDGDILFLDSSTTVYQLARRLQDSSFANLTIATNSLLIIQEFPFFPPHYFMIALGGNYDLQLNAFLGKTTLDGLEKLAFSRAFFSALGVDAGGIYSRHENHSLFLRSVLERSSEKNLMVTGDKFGKTGIFRIAGPADIDHLICESGIKGRNELRF